MVDNFVMLKFAALKFYYNKIMQTINELIANEIAASVEGYEGKFSVEVEIDANTVVEVSGWYELNGYCEDDYFNGTGAWVTTYVRVSVEAYTYNEDGEQVANTIEPDTAEIERYAENELAA